MNRLIAALACVLLFTACKKEAAPPAEAEAPAEEVMKDEQEAAPEEPAEPVEEKVEVTPELMDRYLAYWNQEIDVHHQAMAELEKAAKELEKNEGAMAAMKAMGATSEIGNKIDERKAALRKEHKLTEKQVDHMSGLIANVGIGRWALAQGGNQDQMIAEMKKNVAKVPAEQRADAEKQIADMEKGFADLKNGAEARKQYGDEAVDLVIKNDSRIMPLYEKAMKMGSNKR